MHTAESLLAALSILTPAQRDALGAHYTAALEALRGHWADYARTGTARLAPAGEDAATRYARFIAPGEPPPTDVLPNRLRALDAVVASGGTPTDRSGRALSVYRAYAAILEDALSVEIRWL